MKQDMSRRINNQWRVLSCTLMDRVHKKGRDRSNRTIEEPRNQASRSSGRNSNPGFQEYTAGMLTTHPQSSVRLVGEDLFKTFSNWSLIYIARVSYLRNK